MWDMLIRSEVKNFEMAEATGKTGLVYADVVNF